MLTPAQAAFWPVFRSGHQLQSVSPNRSCLSRQRRPENGWSRPRIYQRRAGGKRERAAGVLGDVHAVPGAAFRRDGARREQDRRGERIETTIDLEAAGGRRRRDQQPPGAARAPRRGQRLPVVVLDNRARRVAGIKGRSSGNYFDSGRRGAINGQSAPGSPGPRSSHVHLRAFAFEEAIRRRRCCRISRRISRLRSRACLQSAELRRGYRGPLLARVALAGSRTCRRSRSRRS